ncbi:MAG TPA: DUF3307 domain-containing protein [Bacillota bacterium]|nr:DUF3307 domain-containing protein [Bacillota bacterium]
MLFLLLVFAHLLADYSLQSTFLATMKGKNNLLLVTHAGIWTGTILIAATFAGITVNYFDVFSLFIVHAIADYAKARPVGFYKRLDPLGLGLMIDQMIHMLQIILFMASKGLL